MKCVFLYTFLINFTITAFSQNSARLSNTKHETASNDRWSLNEYVWSHTHTPPRKNDKPVLDFEALDNWVSLPFFEKVTISRDGHYLVYGIQNNVNLRLDSVVVQSTINNWRVVLSSDAQLGFFSADSRQFIFQNKEELCFLQAGTYERRYEKDVENYKVDSRNECLAYKLKNNDNTLVLLNLVTEKEKRINEVSTYNFDETGEWLTYQLKNKNVVLQNLNSGEVVVFANVSIYNFDISGKWLVCQANGTEKDLILYNLKDRKEQRFFSIHSWQLFATGNYLLLNTGNGLDYVNLIDKNINTIWSTIDTNATISSFGFDGTGKQVVFLVTDTSHPYMFSQGARQTCITTSSNSIWYWKEELGKAEMKVNAKILGIDRDLMIQGGASFTDNGHYIRLTLQPIITDRGKPFPDATLVDVWSYQDKILQSTQPYLKEIITYTAILDLRTGKIILPEKENEKLGGIIGDYGLVNKNGRDVYGDRFWEKGYYNDSTWLISLQNGARRLLPPKSSSNSIWFSPNGKYLVYFDAAKQCNYFSYEMSTGKLVNISAGVPSWQLGIAPYNYYLRTPEKPSVGSGIKLWLDGDEGFLVYDKYHDIWQLDPGSKKPPVCITNGYGRLNNISFNLLTFPDNRIGDGTFIGKDTLLLSAFNTKTKLHGFYRKILKSKEDPALLSMDPCYMEWLCDGVNGMYPVKAGNSKAWIVNRQSTTEAPNYFITYDFKTFKQLTFLQSHKKYNWLTAELHSFKQLDGTISQGVLYKPENFNPAQKYPLIISFYGTLSNQLYQYPTAAYIDAPYIFDNPAWMVSHGYLVFIPDIYFIKDEWGPSVVNTVDGAARYLSGLPYVDGRHIGACGHSNSGRFGYYLLTHSHLYAAMALGSGFTGADVLSGALSLRLKHKEESSLEIAEMSAYGTALGNIWQNKAKWIDHIAPLQADNAKSPFLLFHNKKDGDDVRLAVELFIAFRRLEKKVWWLQYDNGAHSVYGNDARDFTIRYTQFFDHYLKCAPPPRWMTQGIRASMKGIETGYELDPAGNCAMKGKNECKVCNKCNEQYRRNPEMFSKPTSEVHRNKETVQNRNHYRR